MKKIFSRNLFVAKTAFLNWRTVKDDDIGNLKVLADGYLLSSILLCRICIADNDDKKADTLIFPILFSANHGIELYLKSLVWILNKLSNSQHKIEGTHNIKQIMETLKSRILLYHQDKRLLKNFNESTKDLQEYIKEIYGLIGKNLKRENLDFSRYPVDKNYLSHFYIDDLKNITIDLENFVVRFEKIIESLDNIFSYYYYQELNRDW